MWHGIDPPSLMTHFCKNEASSQTFKVSLGEVGGRNYTFTAGRNRLDDRFLDLTLSAITESWVAVGFSDTDSMVSCCNSLLYEWIQSFMYMLIATSSLVRNIDKILTRKYFIIHFNTSMFVVFVLWLEARQYLCISITLRLL